MLIPEDYAIWWTCAADCESIGAKVEGAPDYIASEYRDRFGRDGRGRLWASAEMYQGVVFEWPDTPMGRRLSEFAGIVIERNDAAALATLPGVITDFELRRI